jgi:hypothetical protein
MGLIDLFKQLTNRSYLPKVSRQHTIAPYEEAGAGASYSHQSGYIVLPISYVEGTSLPSSEEHTSVAVIRLHRPITTKTVSYTNQRHGLLPEVHEPIPGQYLRSQDSAVVMGTSRTVAAPQFGSLESHGAAWSASGSTNFVFTTDEHFANKATEKLVQNSYDGTDTSLIPTVGGTVNTYPRREI